MSVVKQVAKWGGGCIAGAFILGKFVSPYLTQLQRIKSEELITDESIVRRFEQCLREGEVRFNEDLQTISEIVNNYFNVESIVERIRTCQPEDKKSLWTDLKLIVIARLIASLYGTYFIFISARAQMVLIGKSFSKNGPVKDEEIFSTCRNFMDEMKGLLSIMTSQLCSTAFEACKDILLNASLDLKLDEENGEAAKAIFYQLKQRTDAAFKFYLIVEKFTSSQIRPSKMLKEFSIYCKSRHFSSLLDHLICDGLGAVAESGHSFLQNSGKPQILLSWVTYLSTSYASDEQEPTSMNWTYDRGTPITNMASRSGIAVGQNRGHITTVIPRAAKPVDRKGKVSKRVSFVRGLIREVVGFAPYERRVMELLKNSKDKRARKLAKRRLGTLTRAKRKVEELNNIIVESRRAH